MRLAYETCDVFTDRRFGGNPLAVVRDAAGLDTAAMQAVAREFNLSETVFVEAADEPSATARIRIFTTAMELPFAGHPNVGAAVLIARYLGIQGDRLRIDQAAGRVEATLARDETGHVVAATITAPKPFALGQALDPAAIAACAGLPSVVGEPVIASCGTPFAVAEVVDEATLASAEPDAAAFRRHLPPSLAIGLHLFCRQGESDGLMRLRSRMFAPLGGLTEDPATGSANVALGGLLLARAGGQRLSLSIEQGIEMGRPSQLAVEAWTDQGVIRASVGGGVVAVSRGWLYL
ncbi:PhzF family phenazine biosynthesis protein [Roseomonas stagni]|uniref:PhzF family phenazine biosynthesis protein n=1 Tax=Falsiroseomonas algicola TaxID=2716930 RepID=A0A6M1LH75_9PROT|nr:PhzF family phenazine biosynthesis protein [Falsiroseomonas algicola]NGM19274.1 PhzF family phenazine biosynthesis protein [Falsiroseomonas algicola]